MTTLVARRRANDNRLTIVGVVGFAAAVAAASQIAMPLPFTPVPITLQPMLVILAGLMLGPIAGAASMLLYLAAGAAGLPVFTPVGALGIARLFGPTGGYLIAYPIAAFVAGSIVTRTSSFIGRSLAALAGVAVIYFGGVTQLAVLGNGYAQAIRLGVMPFAVFDIAKAFVAAFISRPRATRPER
ncbi:MAG TPA: biotin transporter BioY [Gemmatimonadaceae bacterium]|jgi:biotin transport system substrate-specific component